MRQNNGGNATEDLSQVRLQVVAFIHPRRSYCDVSVWLYDLEHCFTCCARLWDNFHQVWPSTTYPCLNYSFFWCWYVISSCDLDLWPVVLESSWYIKCHVIKVCTKFERNQTIFGWIIDNFVNFLHTLRHAVTLTFDLLTLNFYSISGVMRLNSVQNLSEIE